VDQALLVIIITIICCTLFITEWRRGVHLDITWDTQGSGSRRRHGGTQRGSAQNVCLLLRGEYQSDAGGHWWTGCAGSHESKLLGERVLTLAVLQGFINEKFITERSITDFKVYNKWKRPFVVAFVPMKYCLKCFNDILWLSIIIRRKCPCNILEAHRESAVALSWHRQKYWRLGGCVSALYGVSRAAYAGQWALTSRIWALIPVDSTILTLKLDFIFFMIFFNLTRDWYLRTTIMSLKGDTNR